jgi:hypothetical protein
MTNAAKRLTAARFAGVPELEETFSDTTDTKDIWDGGGDQAPSAGPHVVLLQESLLAMGYELPKYGADGIYGSETTSAVTQFQIDAGHPWPPGHDWEHIGGIAGPNTMAHFDMFDPGGTVGNATRATTRVHAEAVVFSESPDNPFAGFDDTSPPALVVGATTRRRVRVHSEPNEADVTYVVEDPGVATVGVTDEGIVVGGDRAGTTLVRATSGDLVLAELVVCVKDAREAIVNFFFASDSSDPNYATIREHDKATLLTLRLNRVWRRQANVHFTLGQVADVKVPAGLGPAVGASDFGSFLPSARPGNLNVFCVWSLEPGVDPVRAADAPEDPFLMLLPDSDCPDGMDVMHAAGRYLGYRGRGATSGLMSGCGEGADRRRVPKELADAVNP